MADPGTLTLSWVESDIAVLTFDDPQKGANVLSSSVLDELDGHLAALESRSDIAGLIFFSGKSNAFIAGADIREFLASINAPREEIVAMCHRGRKLFQRLATCPFVTVAAIDGICVGGGAELALWCDRRVFSDRRQAQYGFPEVKLGLFPGWGGTARTPRIIGLSNAVEMVTGGESIDGKKALAMELATDVVPSDRLKGAAIRLVRAEQQSREYVEDRERWRASITMSETELGFLGATASAMIQQQTKGQYPAPMAALETMLGAAALDVDAACDLEAEGMAELFGSDINRALINVFFLADRNKKDRGIDRTDVEPRPIKMVGVLGAGIMGAGIAAANLRRQLPVALTDAVPESLARGVEGIVNEVAYDRVLKGPSVEKAVHTAAMLNATTSDSELAQSDLIIEAVVENVDVKKEIYARLEPLLSPGAVLASNTSTIPITELAADLASPDRFCGIHFFNPVRRMPLVEIIRGKATSDETVATAVAYAKQIGKSPIVVNDGPGFLVNRLLLPYMNEALELLADGAELKAIERAAKAFGMPMGPLTLYDVVGLDTAVYAGSVMVRAFPDRVVASPMLPAMLKSGRLGQKNGKGFFSYGGRKGKAEPDPEADALVAQYVRQQGSFDAEQITARLFLPMVLEATRVIEEKIVREVRDVDLGLIYGIGFPPFRGGLLFWADTVGAAKIVEMLKPLEALGPRAEPTPMLLELARSGGKFYDMIQG